MITHGQAKLLLYFSEVILTPNQNKRSQNDLGVIQPLGITENLKISKALEQALTLAIARR